MERPHFIGSSLALTIWRWEHQERWGHSRGSAGTESKVLVQECFFLNIC